jgi:hypothetical protein
MGMTENELFLLPALRRTRDLIDREYAVETANCQQTFEELSAKGVRLQRLIGSPGQIEDLVDCQAAAAFRGSVDVLLRE